MQYQKRETNHDNLSSTIDFSVENNLDNDLIELFSPIKSDAQSTDTNKVADVISPGLRYPRTKEGMTMQDFETWTMVQLQVPSIADRCINKTGNKNKLVENAYGAYSMGLEVTVSDVQEEQAEIARDVHNKLLLEGGMLRLPNPKSLLND